MKVDGNFGLSTYDALGILYDDIEELLLEKVNRTKSRWNRLKNLFSHRNEHSTISWVSLGLIFLIGFSLVAFSVPNESTGEYNLFLEGAIVMLIGLGNILLLLWDDSLRLEEIPSKVKGLLEFIEECREKCVWHADNYPHLCCPYSPCISLQWTYRDDKLVNLPTSLLVRGDTVLLRPGQPAPAACSSQEAGSGLAFGEVYSPPQKHEAITQPTPRTPLPNKRFTVQETPLLRNLREVFDECGRCPVSSYDKQRHFITVTVALHVFLPTLLVVVCGVNAVRGSSVTMSWQHWYSLLVVSPALVALPLLPLAFPLLWLSLNYIGYTKITTAINSLQPQREALEKEESEEGGWSSVEEGGCQLVGCSLHQCRGHHTPLSLTRTINPLHVLGSVTALCCVDKKGILSWPNPTAEKVFFLRTTSAKPTVPSDLGRSECEEEIPLDDGEEDEAFSEAKQDTNEVGGGRTVSQVLDLTHDAMSPFKLQFDDPRWKDHMGSLKPLGLAILLNTCNVLTHQHYLQFCSHVTCEALHTEDLVPVTNRRCLCELSKQIGFTDDVLKNFKLLDQLSTFKHVQPETVRRDMRLARSLSTKLKLPFPHMVSVVTSEVAVPNSLQLFSQATGDIALDSCVDFWDGTTLRLLTPADRKKVLDFYQRTSLTAYCTAFGYRPLSRGVSHQLSNIYMELPADSHQLYLRNASPTPLNPPPILSHSTDSLFGGEMCEEEANDIEGCFGVQCNQIFLGMVTMQYQAQSEMVQLIEQLMRACIRFVHFSKENELRSRVFSEKMGLESGWNCHISLLSSDPPAVETSIVISPDDEDTSETPLLSAKRGSLEGTKNISASAPGAINLEPTRTSHKGSSARSVEEEVGIVEIEDRWQSVSCLTDSTEHSAPLVWPFIGNRAKLPRGIEEVRPHLQQVDNVPLLVSLFTDCTPATTAQMIGIMQEYGEVVIVMGSSANMDNNAIFLKANASVSVEPLYPQVCQKVSVCVPAEDGPSPCCLGQRLNSLPSTVFITRQRPISLFHLIMHSRHYMTCMWSCVQFWLTSSLLISSLHILSSLLFLPPIFSIGQVVWLTCVVVPVMTVALVFTPTVAGVMQRPGPKPHTTLTSEVVVFAVWCYGLRAVPSLVSLPLTYQLALLANCPWRGEPLGLACAPPRDSLPEALRLYTQAVHAATHISLALLVIHLAVISMSFVYRDKLTWRKSPLQNKVWYRVSLLLVIVQIMCLLFVLLPEEKHHVHIPPSTSLLFLLSPLAVFLVSEIVKWQEIKANIRYEKRARLAFGTKLGMNSPF